MSKKFEYLINIKHSNLYFPVEGDTMAEVKTDFFDAVSVFDYTFKNDQAKELFFKEEIRLIKKGESI